MINSIQILGLLILLLRINWATCQLSSGDIVFPNDNNYVPQKLDKAHRVILHQQYETTSSFILTTPTIIQGTISNSETQNQYQSSQNALRRPTQNTASVQQQPNNYETVQSIPTRQQMSGGRQNIPQNIYQPSQPISLSVQRPSPSRNQNQNINTNYPPNVQQPVRSQQAEIQQNTYQLSDNQNNRQDIADVLYVNNNRDLGDSLGTRDSQATQKARIAAPVTDFAWNLFKATQALSSKSNIVLSPLLIQLTLGLFEYAAETTTRQEIKNVIQARPWDLQYLVSSLRQTQPQTTLELASAAFMSIYLRLNESFALAARNADVELYPVNFEKSAETVSIINQWVSKITHNYITSLLNPGKQTQGQQLLLTNAVYFRGQWKYSFNKTMQDYFYVPDQTKTATYMMLTKKFRTGEFSHAGGGRWIEIPYDGEEFSMVIVVPERGNNLETLTRELTSNDFNRIIGSLSINNHKLVNLKIPKFYADFNRILTGPLINMGLTTVFSNLARLPYFSLNTPVKISDCIHQAVLTIDEQGTIATAANAFSVITLSISLPEEELSFIVNQPFLSMIVDKRNQIPIFVSQIYDP